MQSIIHTPTNQLENSLLFYSSLDFKILSTDTPTLVSDGKALIEINPDRFARAGVKLISKSWESTAKDLEKITTIIKTETGYLLSDPGGCWIYLIESTEIPDQDMTGIEPSVLGNFAGVSLETISIAQSQKIWETLGFSAGMGSAEQGWMTLQNETGFGISLMKPNSCPHLFFNPSLTYFNGKDNPAIIQKIRDLEIPIAEEITAFNKEGIVDNIIIRDPGGFGFFIFND